MGQYSPEIDKKIVFTVFIGIIWLLYDVVHTIKFFSYVSAPLPLTGYQTYRRGLFRDRLYRCIGRAETINIVLKNSEENYYQVDSVLTYTLFFLPDTISGDPIIKEY